MIPYLDDERHERLWRICDALVSTSGARAAMVCDAQTGAVLVSVGDTTGSGNLSGIETLAPGERLVRGDSGQLYGVDVPGGAMLAVLHDVAALERVRAAAIEAVAQTAELLEQAPAAAAPERQASGSGLQAPGQKPSKPGAKSKAKTKPRTKPSSSSKPRAKSSSSSKPRTKPSSSSKPRAKPSSSSRTGKKSRRPPNRRR